MNGGTDGECWKEANLTTCKKQNYQLITFQWKEGTRTNTLQFLSIRHLEKMTFAKVSIQFEFIGYLIAVNLFKGVCTTLK